MPPPTNMSSASQSTRLSTTGIILISVAIAVLFLVLASGIIILQRRKRSADARGGESTWQSLWILCRRQRRRRSSRQQQQQQHDMQFAPPDASSRPVHHHSRKKSTATVASHASTLHECRPVMKTATRHNGWFFRGSPQQEVADPYEQAPYGYEEYEQHPSPLPSPLPHAHESMATTLVAVHSPMRMGFASPPASATTDSASPASTSLAVSQQYPFAPSERASPVYGHFAARLERQHEEPSTSKREPKAPPMARLPSDAPSLTLSVPRSVSPTPTTHGDGANPSASVTTTTGTLFPRPALQRDCCTASAPSQAAPRTHLTTPQIAISAPDTYFSPRRQLPAAATSSSSSSSSLSPDSTPVTPSCSLPAPGPAPSPGLHTAFRSAFFLDAAGPQRGVAISSMPQTPAIEDEW